MATSRTSSQTRYSLRNSHGAVLGRYTYAPLAADTIRLFRLHPAGHEEVPLRCTLFHTDLQGAPPYVALSYAWGSQTSKHTLHVNPHDPGESASTLVITASLFHALQRLRRDDEDVLLWVDAVCIDQNNLAERNVQTANMRRIYQKAESVAVWLGLEYNESAEALHLVRDLISAYKSSSDQINNLLLDEEDRLRALVRLFRRQYWWRIWVIQEVTCGRRSTVYCGEEEIIWTHLERVCDIFKEHETVLRQIFYKNLSYVRTLIAGGPKGLQLSRYSPGMTTPPLLELLTSHKGKKATEPRDKVFALVGISQSSDAFGGIDYSRSLKDVYTHTARHIIETTKRLDVICLKQHFKTEYGLPSWAPNWTRAHTKTGVALVGLHHCEPEFKACGNTLAKVDFSEDGYGMVVKGVIIDTITTVSVSLIKKGFPGDPIPPLQAFENWLAVYRERFGSDIEKYARFGKVLSCGSWDEEDAELIAGRLDSISSLAEDMLVEDSSKSDEKETAAQSSTRPEMLQFSRTTTMSSTYSNLDEEDALDDEIDTEDRERLGMILGISVMMNRRRLIVSNKGYVGLGLWNVEEGDILCILLGCRFPVVLRRREEGGYVLVGEAYVEGIMNGELTRVIDDGKVWTEELEVW